MPKISKGCKTLKEVWEEYGRTILLCVATTILTNAVLDWLLALIR